MNSLKIFFISIILKIQNNILLLLQSIKWRSLPLDVSNIIIYKNGNIGDIITGYPAIKAVRLKYPDARITLLTSPGSKNLVSAANLLESQNLVNEIIYYYQGNILPLCKKIRTDNFDICFIMSDDRTHFLRELRNLIFFFFLNIKYLRGFSVNTIKYFQNSFAQKNPYPYENEVERNLKMLGIKQYNIPSLFKFQNDNISSKIYTKTSGLKNPLIIATGAKLKSKQWSNNNFFEIAKLWIKNKGDIVFIGNKQDSADAEIIISKIKEWQIRTQLMFQSNIFYNLCNETTLNETIYLIESAVTMIGNDSGPAHLSSFTSTKVVTIQASQDFKLKWDPYLSKHLVLRSARNPICRCSRDSCGYCINDITYNDVWQKLKGFI